MVGHVEHRPHPLPLAHQAVDTVEPREVDMPLTRQQDVTGLHPPYGRGIRGQTLSIFKHFSLSLGKTDVSPNVFPSPTDR